MTATLERAERPRLGELEEGARRRRRRPEHALQPCDPARTNMVLWIVLILTGGFVAGTTAAFNGSVGEGASTYGATALTEPTAFSIALQGSDIALTSTFGAAVAGGGTTGARYRYYWPTGVSEQGVAPTCATASSSYADATKDLGSTTFDNTPKVATYPATADGVSTNGRWMCAMALTTYPNTDPVAPAQQWLSQVSNPVQPVQLGHIVQSVQLANGGSSATGTLSAGDVIQLFFNQDVDASGRPSPARICMKGAVGGNRILIEKIGGNACNHQANPQNTATVLGNLHWTVGTNLPDSVLFNVTPTWVTARELRMTVTGTSTANLSACTAALALTGCFRMSTQYVNNPATALESASGAKALCIAQPAGTPDTGICWPLTTGRV